MPVDCRVAKMLVYGALLSCVSPTLTVAACLSYKSPFLDARSGDDGDADGSDDGFAPLFDFGHAYHGNQDLLIWNNLSDFVIRTAAPIIAGPRDKP
mgnify:CR=1 FL=1